MRLGRDHDVPLWTTMSPCGPRCPPVDHDVPLWTTMSPCGPRCPPVDHEVQLWTTVRYFRTTVQPMPGCTIGSREPHKSQHQVIKICQNRAQESRISWMENFAENKSQKIENSQYRALESRHTPIHSVVWLISALQI